jgi:RHS repeat-associated protein
LQIRASLRGSTDYSGSFLYQDNELSCIFTPVGRIVPMQYNNETFWKHEYNLKDHLGNTRIVFAAHPHGQPEVMQQTSYYPFGMTLQQQNFGGVQSQPNKHLYNSKELQDDELAGVSLDWYDYGARMYDAQIGRWHVVDPHAERYASWSPYNYVYNNPINGIDPDGRDGILIVFPQYMVDTETRLGRQPLGHAGVLLINNKTGYMRYYEYGRYATSDGTKGRVRNISVPDVVIGKDGKPTIESLNRVLGVVSKESGQGGAIEGAYIKSDDFKSMFDFAEGKLKESNVGNDQYDADRKPYNLLNHNCATFSTDVLNQDEEVSQRSPNVYINTPRNTSTEYRKNFDKVDFNPNDGTTITPTKSTWERVKDWWNN